ncbi:MAG: D-glycero-beta-D-manno-heptose-7-phosphate kinase [Desulfobacterales bacterium]|nr:D-glycero-beta-D-manno-heptose-7-phosphate kinase [Desulfobacterales bacterium]MBF0396249.1 D-glycero-beta-D-manno-heptose-7-phosphate kinase [Desulfobacterales bacterium]
MNVNLNIFDKCKVLVVGDLMLDEYIWGTVDRISPEAPVQVVNVKNETYTLGGAGNVVNNLIALGAKVAAVGLIGSGGELLMDIMKKLSVNTEGIIETQDRPTTRKTRIIAGSQHIVRIDREKKHPVSDEIFQKLVNSVENIIPNVDIVVISDYAKGVISPPLIKKITKLCKKHNKISIADPKGLDFTKYNDVTILTPNKKEAAVATNIEIYDDLSLNEAANKILETTTIDRLIITCGKDGMVLFERNESPVKIKSEARQVFDVSGAGDTVVAVLAVSLGTGSSFEDAATLSNKAAGIVVGKVGTATVSREELEKAINPYSFFNLEKQKNLSELKHISQDLKKKKKTIVLTNGCFDLLHAGHIMLFEASKKLGDILIVAIDDDESIKELKGPGRPLISERDRIKILSAIDSIDHVTIFSSKDLHEIIKTIKPDILAKGNNYKTDTIVGGDLVEKIGGRIVLIPITENISSTQIINNIKQNSI